MQRKLQPAAPHRPERMPSPSVNATESRDEELEQIEQQNARAFRDALSPFWAWRVLRH